MTVNSLSGLEELHLLAQTRRGRHRLIKSTAEFILKEFPNLKHLGNFQFWNMTR